MRRDSPIIKLCEAATCKAEITWRYPSPGERNGFWEETKTGKKHLCPAYNPKEHYPNRLSNITKSTIDARLELVEKTLLEINKDNKNILYLLRTKLP